MKNIIVSALIIFGLLFVGCAQRKVAPIQPGDQQTQQVPGKVAPDEGRMLKPEERITEQQLAKVEAKDEPAMYKEQRGLFNDIYFDFDKYDIRPDARPVLQEVAAWLLKNTDARLSIEGHCDERGTNEYNLALGDRRARAARDALIALGVAPKRIETISFGEEKPQCTEQTEECWAKNRRAHFVVLR